MVCLIGSWTIRSSERETLRGAVCLHRLERWDTFTKELGLNNKTFTKFVAMLGLSLAMSASFGATGDEVRYAQGNRIAATLDGEAAGSFSAVASAGKQNSGLASVDIYRDHKRNTFGGVAGVTTLSGVPTNTVQAPDPVAAVPEPSTYALMLGGLALVGFMARRRTPR